MNEGRIIEFLVETYSLYDDLSDYVRNIDGHIFTSLHGLKVVNKENEFAFFIPKASEEETQENILICLYLLLYKTDFIKQTTESEVYADYEVNSFLDKFYKLV